MDARTLTRTGWSLERVESCFREVSVAVRRCRIAQLALEGFCGLDPEGREESVAVSLRLLRRAKDELAMCVRCFDLSVEHLWRDQAQQNIEKKGEHHHEQSTT